jgi:hypothetical protein
MCKEAAVALSWNLSLDPSVRIEGVLAKIRNQNPPNTSQNCYPYTNLFVGSFY